MPAASDAERARTGGWRLAAESSQYLREAAEQPVEWYPWSAEAFEVAKRAHRPILLDIGASWCHWCHVMDEGTYSDPEVARLLRQHFVAIKVDRDERPEVDRRFQRQVSLLTGEGGWPLTAFATPDGEVFLGGTYFPPQDGLGRPGFRRVLAEVARLWKEEPEKIRANADQVREALARSRGRPGASPSSASAFRSSVARALHESFDPVNGGFGHAPKFPHPTALSLLLLTEYATGSAADANVVRTSLVRMADGGLYDHVGGGFHRYSVDEGWHVPHFEKMTIDNAALLEVYTEGARRFGEPRFREVVEGTLRWMGDVLEDPRGGFAASQDADNAPGDDGNYYTWSRPELKAILEPDELRLVTRYFGVGSDGRMPHDPDRNVLFRLMSLAEAGEELGSGAAEAGPRLDRALAKMRRARAERPVPAVDRALYTDLNGRCVRAVVRAGRFLGDANAIASARRAADRFLSEAFEPGRGMAHRVGAAGATGRGLLEDQAEFAYGLVELAGALAEPRYLGPARDLLELVHREFASEEGILRDVAPRLYDGLTVRSLAEPSYPLEDSPHLSANAAVALAEVRLASLTNEDAPRDRARSLLDALLRRVEGAGLFGAGTALASALLETPSARIVVEGGGPSAAALRTAAEVAWHPHDWVFTHLPPAPFSLPEELAAPARKSESPRALICFGTRCLAPIAEPEGIGPALATGGSAPDESTR